jgi:lipopolysaccharide export system permease protein
VYNNKVTPWANLKGYSMLWDIKVTKVTLNIQNGIFYREIPGYSIKVKDKDPQTNLLTGVTVYNHSNRDGNTNVTLADSGRMYTIFNDSYLVFELFNGSNYAEQKNAGGDFNDTPLVINKFKKNRMVFSLESFGMKRTDENQFKYHEYMKDISELNAQIDSSRKEIANSTKTQLRAIKNMNNYQFKTTQSFRRKTDTTGITKKDTIKEILPGKWIDEKIAEINGSYRMQEIDATAKSNIQSFRNQLTTNYSVLSSKKKEMRRAQIEKWHKYTYAFACLVMFVIGACLGAIIKKGGFGMPVVVAVSFFIFYYVLMQLGDKYAREGLIPILTGVWFPNFVLTIIAVFLVIKATKDSQLFNIRSDNKWLQLFISFLKNKKLLKASVS